ncbi:MAG TPA: TolC family protein [Rhodanobacteraceae bacterium]|nr:TolC family protein [Rhodanobacteraceae bacterium]
MRQSAPTTVAVASGDAEDADRRASRGHRRVRAFAAGALASVLVACATYAPAPIDPTKSSDDFAARRLDAASLGENVARVLPQASSAWPPPEWDRGSLLAVALTENGSLAVARAEVNSALAHEITAGESPNPTLGLQSEYARREPQHWLYGISFDFLLPQYSVRRLDGELARLGTGGARDQLMEQTWNVRRALIAALSDRESAERRLKVLKQLADAQDAFVALQRQRVAAGEDAPSDLNAAQTTRIDIEQQQADASADAASAQAALATALGMPEAALDGVSISWPEWGDPPVLAADGTASAREKALLSRADLAVAIDDYAQAEKKLERAIARQYPQFEFKPGYYWDHGIAKWPLDVGIVLPLFNRNRGEIAEATAAREVAGQRMLTLQAGIYGEIESAERAEKIARDNLDAALRRNEATRQQLHHADVALGLGAGDRMEHTGVEVLALRAALEAVQARARMQSARNALEDALHAPLSGPELALAKPLSSADSGADR